MCPGSHRRAVWLHCLLSLRTSLSLFYFYLFIYLFLKSHIRSPLGFSIPFMENILFYGRIYWNISTWYKKLFCKSLDSWLATFWKLKIKLKPNWLAQTSKKTTSVSIFHIHFLHQVSGRCSGFDSFFQGANIAKLRGTVCFEIAHFTWLARQIQFCVKETHSPLVHFSKAVKKDDSPDFCI